MPNYYYIAVDGREIECFDVIKGIVTDNNLDAYEGYLIGCAIKYMFRCGRKHQDINMEIQKAINYLEEFKIYNMKKQESQNK